MPDLETASSYPTRTKIQTEYQSSALVYLLSAYKGDSYRRTDLCAVGNGLDSQVAFFLGLCDSHRWDPLSYVVARKQSKRFERALHEGWAAADGTPRNFTWLVRKLLAASTPNRCLKTIAAVAIDSTADPTWARTREYQLEKDLLAEHRLESFETPDLTEPDIKSAKNPKNKVRTFGSDGRYIRSYDIDARPGYKSATNKEPATLFLGYDVHIAVRPSPRPCGRATPTMSLSNRPHRDTSSLFMSLREQPIPDPSEWATRPPISRDRTRYSAIMS